MDAISFLLLLYVASLIFLLLHNARYGIIMFFGTKFTIDLFWNYDLFQNINVLKLLGLIFPLFCLWYYIRFRPRLTPGLIPILILVIFILNLVSGLWGFVVNAYAIYPVPHTPVSVHNLLDWNLRFFNFAGAILITPTILNQPDDLKLLFRSVLISTLIPATIGIFQLIQLPYDRLFEVGSEPYSAQLFHRITAAYHDPVTFAIAMFVALMICTFLLYTESSKELRALYVGYAITCSILLYFTFSRTFWIGFTIFMLLFLLIRRQYRLMVCCVVVLLAFILFLPTTQKRFEREISFLKDPRQYERMDEFQKIGSGRLWLWNDARKHFLKLDVVSMIIGSGRSFGSHNQYIAWILRNGIIGLLVWTFFLYNIALLLWSSYRDGLPQEKPERQFSLLLFMITIVFINMAAQPWDNMTYSCFFWTVIGIFLNRSISHQAA